MSSFYKSLTRSLSKKPFFPIVITVLFIVGASTGLFRLQIDTSVERILPPSHPDIIRQEEFKRNFIDDKKIVIGIQSQLLTQKEGVQFLENLSARLLALPEVSKIIGLPTLKIPSKKEGKIAFQKALESNLETLSKHPLFSDTIVAGNGSITVLQLFPADFWSLDFPGRLLQLLEEESTGDIKMFVAGTAFLEDEMISSIYRDLLILTPLVSLILAAFLSYFWRDLPLTLLCLVTVLLTRMANLGIMGWCDKPVTILTTVLPSIILSTGMAAAVHILSAMRNWGIENLEDILKQVFLPCLFASLTTAVGFGSLMLNPIIQVKEFGFFSMLGVLLSFVVAFGFTVPLACVLKIKKNTQCFISWTHPILFRTHEFVKLHTRKINICFSALLIFCLFLLPGNKVDITVFDNLKPNGAVLKGYEFFQENLSGVSTLELEMTGEPGKLIGPESLEGMLHLASELETNPMVNKTISIAHFVRYLQDIMSEGKEAVPASTQAADQLLFLYRLAGYNMVISDYITEERDRARFSVLIGNISAQEFSTLIELVKEKSKLYMGPDIHCEVTGSVYIYNQINNLLFFGLVKSLLTAFALVGTLLFMFLRSWRLGIIAFLPNAFPLAIIYGVMYLLKIPIDVQSAMVGCIALGISVDGTVHLLHNYREQRQYMTRLEALKSTWFAIGTPVVVATLTLIVVFASMSFSSFRPIRIFGLLCALGLVCALLADLLYLPSLLNREKKLENTNKAESV